MIVGAALGIFSLATPIVEVHFECGVCEDMAYACSYNPGPVSVGIYAAQFDDAPIGGDLTCSTYKDKSKRAIFYVMDESDQSQCTVSQLGLPILIGLLWLSLCLPILWVTYPIIVAYIGCAIATLVFYHGQSMDTWNTVPPEDTTDVTLDVGGYLLIFSILFLVFGMALAVLDFCNIQPYKVVPIEAKL